jgi:hypothetical protein
MEQNEEEQKKFVTPILTKKRYRQTNGDHWNVPLTLLKSMAIEINRMQRRFYTI